MDEVSRWQRDFRAAPSVWVTYDPDGMLSAVYSTREAAQVEMGWRRTVGDRGYAMREQHIHSLELAQRRWTAPRARRAGAAPEGGE